MPESEGNEALGSGEKLDPEVCIGLPWIALFSLAWNLLMQVQCPYRYMRITGCMTVQTVNRNIAFSLSSHLSFS